MSILKTGVIKESTFSTSLLSHYDPNFYTEPDGSVWIRIAHQEDVATNGVFSNTDTFTKSVYKNPHLWFNVSMCNNISGTWEVMVKQKLTSTSSEVKYRWTQRTNPMVGSYADVAPTSSNITRNTSSGYTNGGFGGLYGAATNDTHLVIANSNNGNWFGAFGVKKVYEGGFPGYPNTIVTTGYMDLYLRVDNYISPKARIAKGGVIANDFFEI